MPVFVGPKNIVLFDETLGRAPFDCGYDVETSQYSAVLSDEEAAKYGAALVHAGMTEAATETPSVAAAPDAAPAGPATESPVVTELTAEELAEANAHDAAVAAAVAAAETASNTAQAGDAPTAPAAGA